MRYYIAINSYRSSTSEGFANTWVICRCQDRATQRRILQEGLPVNDQEHIDSDGRRTPVCSTMGIRPATATERRQAARDEEWGRIDWI